MANKTAKEHNEFFVSNLYSPVMFVIYDEKFAWPESIVKEFNVGMNHLQQNNIEAAHKSFVECLKAFDAVEIFNNAALCLFMLGKYDVAIKAVHEKVQQLPKHGGLRYNLGTMFYMQNFFKVAASELEQVCSIDQANLHAKNNYAIACLKCFELDKAHAALADAIFLINQQPTSPQKNDLESLLLYNMGIILMEQGDYIQALSTIEQCMKLHENSPYALNVKACILYYMDKIEEAFELFSTAAKLTKTKDQWFAYYNAGKIAVSKIEESGA